MDSKKAQPWSIGGGFCCRLKPWLFSRKIYRRSWVLNGFVMSMKYSFFFGGVLQDLPTSKSGRMLGRILLEGGEDTQFHHHFRLWGNSPPNIHLCRTSRPFSTPQKQSSPIKFRIQSFRFNYSATYIISHPIVFSEGEFTNFSVWRCRFSLLFVDYPLVNKQLDPDFITHFSWFH